MERQIRRSYEQATVGLSWRLGRGDDDEDARWVCIGMGFLGLRDRITLVVCRLMMGLLWPVTHSLTS